jgi:rare lipoprotein A
MRSTAALTTATALLMGTALGLTGNLPWPAAGAGEYGSLPTLTPIAALLPPPREPDPDPEPRVVRTLSGSASFYASSLAGRRTASGVRYDPSAMVAAHRTLPFGTLLRVTNPANGRTVTVRVVDRGPFTRGRVLDLSRAAAEELDFIRRGHVHVLIEVLEEG